MGVVNLREAPSVANFGERWPLAYFALPCRYFGLLNGSGLEFDAEGSQFVEGRHSIADSRWWWPPAHCVLPTRQVWWGSFFWLCRQVVFWLCRQVVFLAVSPGCFLAALPGFAFWQCRQVVRQCVIVLAILAVQSRDSPGQGQSFIEQVK